MQEENKQLNTVTISVDEYFELRERANLASVFYERLNGLECRFNDLDRQVMNLSGELYNFKTADSGQQ